MATFAYQESDVHRRYDLGRNLTSEATDALVDLLRGYVARPVKLIVDVGSGIRRFTAALAEAFAAQVLGVEPAANMRLTAESKSHPATMRIVHGQAESIPLDDGVGRPRLHVTSFASPSGRSEGAPRGWQGSEVKWELVHPANHARKSR